MDKYKLYKTEHDYAGCIPAIYNRLTGTFETWQDFKIEHFGFDDIDTLKWDDTYNFVARYDIFESGNSFRLELFIILQRKGLITKIYIDYIAPEDYEEVIEWLNDRSKYIQSLWKEAENRFKKL